MTKSNAVVGGQALGGHVERFSVSISRPLFEWGEEERQSMGMNWSEFVAFLYERLRDEVEHQQRLARYVAAYAKIPETSAERALSDISVGLLGT